MASNYEKQRDSKDYLFEYTSTLNPTKEYSPDEIAKQDEVAAKWIRTDATLGDYCNYFHESNMVQWSKKRWVPIWLWRLVADGEFIESDVQ